MTTPQGMLADKMQFQLKNYSDVCISVDEAQTAIAALRQAAAPQGREAEDSRRIEVDIGAAMTALQASPELCEMMNEMVGGPALVEAQAEIERLNAIIALTPAVAPDGAGEAQPKLIDNDQDEITVSLDGRELRGWSYASDDERRTKMLAAREYVEGWCDGRETR